MNTDPQLLQNVGPVELVFSLVALVLALLPLALAVYVVVTVRRTHRNTDEILRRLETRPD